MAKIVIVLVSYDTVIYHLCHLREYSWALKKVTDIIKKKDKQKGKGQELQKPSSRLTRGRVSQTGTGYVRNSNSRAFYDILVCLDTPKGQTRADGHNELGCKDHTRAVMFIHCGDRKTVLITARTQTERRETRSTEGAGKMCLPSICPPSQTTRQPEATWETGRE